MNKNINAKGRRLKGSFLAIPHAVLKSDAYLSLRPSAVKLLVDVAGQFNGKNNGDLAACMSIMKSKGWNSSATLTKARNELLNSGLIEITRQGGMNAGPSLYAVTWRPIDECLRKDGTPRHDAKPTEKPSGLWKLYRHEAAA